MKNNITLAGIALVLLSSCGEKKESGDKVQALSDLKKQQIEIGQKIAELEAELGDLADTKEEKMFEVGVQTIHPRNFKTCIQVQGNVDAMQNVNVSPQSPGIVKEIFVKAGQYVTEGQLLAEIDDAVLTQGIEELKTQLTFATTMYNKQKNLWDLKIGTEVQFINAKTQKEALENKLKTMEKQVDLYKFKAPVNGVIDAMDLKVGQLYAMGMPGMRITNNSQMKVKAMVTDAYIGKVKPSNAVSVEFPDINTSIDSRLSYISKSIDPYSRSFAVEVLLPQGTEYRQNMMAILNIVDYQNGNAIVLPVSVVQKSEKGSFVYIAQGNKAKKMTITTGKSYQGKVEVLSGLQVGQKVIVLGVSDVNDGDNIKY